MLKSLLIGLGDSDDSRSVLDLGLHWAKRFDALAVGLAVVDEPGVRTSGSMLIAGDLPRHTTDPAPSLISSSRWRGEQILQRFARRCGEAGVACTILEDFGAPFARILLEAQRYDLILLGQQIHLDDGWDGEPDGTLGKLLRESARPVVAVPKSPGGGESVVLAYDGSTQAARALYAFEASGLGYARAVHVVSVASDYQDAARHADRAIGFLHLHGIEATPHPVDTSVPTAEVILRKVRYLEAGLLVMGAFGRSMLREFFLGSVTRTALKESPVPVFCYH